MKPTRDTRPFSKRYGLAIALLTLGMLIVLALAAPLLTPQNPFDLAQLDILDARLRPGSAAGLGDMTYWLGTDAQGRDMFSAVIYGLRLSLLVGGTGTGLALLLGVAVGLTAALSGRWVDAALMRLADLQLAFPTILLALVLLAVLGPGVGKVIAALVASQWAYFARATRSVAIVEREKAYVEAARLMQLPAWRILFLHLLPNCMPSLVVLAAMQLAAAISLEATLSFLGIGLPVTEPSLGLLIANGYQYLMAGNWWISVFPGLGLFALIAAIHLLAERLEQIWQPGSAVTSGGSS